jgi:hypothetical protein
MTSRGHSPLCTGWPPLSRSTLDPFFRGQQCAEAPLGLGPAEPPSSCLVVREAISRSKMASLPSLHGLPRRRRRRPQEHGWASSARSLGMVAQEVRMPAVPSSPCPRPRPASGAQCPKRATSVHACLSTRSVSSVRCGRLSVQVSAVRRPTSGVGVRCPCVPASAVAGRSEVVDRGGGAGRRTAGRAGVGVVARCLHDRLVVCPSRSLALEASAGCDGPAEVSVLDLAVVVGGGWAVARSTAWPTRIGRVRARIVCR